MYHDPIVEEVRAIRERLAAAFDFDIRKIAEDAQQRQETSPSRIVSFQRKERALPSSTPAPPGAGNLPSPQVGPAAES
jgi:hypothetical protein